MSNKQYVIFIGTGTTMGVAVGAPAAVKMLEERTEGAKFDLGSRDRVRSFLEEEEKVFADRNNFSVYSHDGKRFLGSIYQVQE